MAREVLIGDILKRIKRPVQLQDDQDYKLVTIKLNHKGVVLRDTKKGAEIKSGMYEVREGDFILSGIDARNGAFGIVPAELDGAVVTNDFWYFEIDENVISKKLFLELTATSWFDEICKLGSDGTTQRIRLQKDKFFNQSIILPDEDEQNQLLNRLLSVKEKQTELAAEITNQKQLLSQLKQAILQEAIQGKLTADWRAQNPNIEPARELLKRIKAEKERLVKEKKIKKEKPIPPIAADEIPFDLPEGWVWCRLGELLLGSDAGKSPDCEKRPARNKEWGVLTTTSIQLGFFDEKANKVLPANFEINPTQVVEAEDILITRAGPLNRTGVCCKVDAISYNLILSDKTIRLKHATGMVSPDFIVNTINSKQIRNLLIPSMTGMAESQVNISQNNIKSIPFPLAPYEEQKAIFEKTVSLIEKCRILDAEITQSEEYAQMLMQAVLKEAFEPAAATEPEAEEAIAMAAEPVEAFGKQGEFGF